MKIVTDILDLQLLCYYVCIFQESTVEVQTVEMAAYPTEGYPLESEQVCVFAAAFLV